MVVGNTEHQNNGARTNQPSTLPPWTHSTPFMMLRTALSSVSRWGISRVGVQAFHTSTTNCYEDDLKTQKVERLEKTINQVMLLGRVGADPEKRGTEQHPVVTFSMATHNNYRKGDDLIQQTDWHRIAVFKPYLRETVYRYMTKGQRVMVQGRLGYLERRDPDNNSIVVKSATIVAEDVIFFNKGEGGY